MNYNALKQANVKVNMDNLEYNYDIKDKTFEEYMDDDFNTPNVISYLLELVKSLNNEIRNKGENVLEYASKILVITKILGLKYELVKFSDEDKDDYQKWLEYRNNKDFGNADIYREKLIQKNIL